MAPCVGEPGRGGGQEERGKREGIKGVRLPLLPWAGVEQRGRATRTGGGGARRLYGGVRGPGRRRAVVAWDVELEGDAGTLL